MADIDLVDPGTRPFTTFRFLVEMKVEGVADKVCGATFSEVDGLEMTMEPKTIREGGNNTTMVHFVGPVSYGQLTLKRGMTPNFDLWKWFNLMLTNPSLRADAEVVIFADDGQTERARFVLSRCVPVKLKSPPLNAKDGGVAIEEFQLAYEMLNLKKSLG